jgi:PAS domain S-box-containing protein
MGGTREGIDRAVATAFLTACPDAFMAVDASFRLIAWNPAAERLFGWSAEEVIGGHPPHLTDEQEARLRAAMWDPDATAARGIEHRLHRDGRRIAVVPERETVLTDDDGRVVGWGRFVRAAGVDELRLSLRNDLSLRLSEATRAEEVRSVVAAALEQLLGVRRAVVVRGAAASSPVRAGIGMTHEESAAVALDAGALREAASGRVVRSALPADADGPQGVLLLPMGPRADGWVLALLHPAAEPPPEDAVVLAVALAGEVWAAFHRVDLVAALEEKIAALESVDELRADHIAGVCHDLRAPLAAMRAFVTTMRRVEDRSTAEERRELLDIMERQVGRFSGLVDDMLLGARLDAGQLVPDERSAVDLGACARLVAESLSTSHRARLVLDDAGGGTVCGDRRQLERVVQNLIDNALTHTPAGTAVTVRIRRLAARGVLEVHDDGPGISDERRRALFTRYGASGAGSIGLGLYTTKGIVDVHGGTIDVRSAPGEGTTFAVRLPLADERRAP